MTLYGDTDKGEHGYMEHYRRHLGPRRFRRNTLFEIGVGGFASRAAGGSLAIWRDYLLRSTIVGIDLHEKDIAWGERVRFVRADQNNPDELDVAVERHGRPDIVIDDGSHVGEHIRTSFDHLWPLLRSGGIYVVEDLVASYNPDFGGSEPPPCTSGVGLVQELVDAAQALDPLAPKWRGKIALPAYPEILAVTVYPGIAFVDKR